MHSSANGSTCALQKRIMKTLAKVFGSLVTAGTFVALSAPAAHAAAFTINFCPGGAGCPANVTEARLTFTEDLLTPDLNDYTLDLKIVGGAGDPTYIDQISFTVEAADNVTGAGGYEVKPSLLSAPGGAANWFVFYDNVNNGSGCSSDTNNSNEVCAQSGVALNAGNGVLVNGANIWQFSVNLADDLAALGAGSAVNLRAAFVDANGGNGGILSPNGGLLDPCRVNCGNETTAVPEPASMVLLGSGLLAVARASRRRRG